VKTKQIERPRDWTNITGTTIRRKKAVKREGTFLGQAKKKEKTPKRSILKKIWWGDEGGKWVYLGGEEY